VTIIEALRGATEDLTERGVPSPRNDAELLLAKAVGLGRTALYAEHDRDLSDRERAAFDALVERRARREPLAYVLGEWGFRRLMLEIDSRVLVPRPETEVLVERCLELIRDLDEPRVLDVGTGSGAIALALADEHQGARVTAIDSSPEALELAAENAAATGVGDRVDFVEHDLVEGLALGEFDLVVSNPPYVLPDEIEGLEPEVRDWEPRTALVGKAVTEAVAAAARDALVAGGWIVLEVADGSAADVVRKLQEFGYVTVESSQDLVGIDRIVEGKWKRSRTSSERSGQASP
jgi:release factor glutamine methyltransferase